MQFKLPVEKKDTGEVKGPTMEKDCDFLTIVKEDVAGKTLFPGRIFAVALVIALVAFTTVISLVNRYPTVLRVQPGQKDGLRETKKRVNQAKVRKNLCGSLSTTNHII
jgi:hypothetical protein